LNDGESFFRRAYNEIQSKFLEKINKKPEIKITKAKSTFAMMD
jgi:hypothetical protein